jgi:stearoyl-CoA desaturase (delta-9 desaturase)
LFGGAWLYRNEALNRETLEKYGHGTPDDWLERNLYGRFPFLGIALMAMLDVMLFGLIGIIIFAVQMVWIPFWAAGVINGLGHYLGYRNFETSDASTNIMPWGILIGGEELHNNHHAYAPSARLSNKWWELDIGWLYIRLLQMCRLARVRRLAPRVQSSSDKQIIDIDTVRAVLANRFHIMKLYGSKVIRPVLKEAQHTAGTVEKQLLRHARKLMTREDIQLDGQAQETVSNALLQNGALQTVYQFKQQLKAIWARTSDKQTSRTQSLQAWCSEAEQTGIRALEEFARYLRGYALQKA